MYQVLIADDEEIERLSFARKIRKHFGESCQVMQAENGLKALQMVEEHGIPVVFMDIGMPGMDGAEAAERIRERHPDCVIVFLTAYDEFSYAKRAISIHALEYLLKPCDDEELIPVMEEALRQAALLKEREGEGPIRREREADHDGGLDGSEELQEKNCSRVAAAIRQYVRENYSRDISMQDAARAMNYSEVYFCRLFKQCFDQNFTAYLTHMRIREAKKLLEDPRASIRDVSRKVGYADSKYFSKIFKRITGQLPSEYRDSLPASE